MTNNLEWGNCTLGRQLLDTPKGKKIAKWLELKAKKICDSRKNNESTETKNYPFIIYQLCSVYETIGLLELQSEFQIKYEERAKLHTLLNDFLMDFMGACVEKLISHDVPRETLVKELLEYYDKNFNINKKDGEEALKADNDKSLGIEETMKFLKEEENTDEETNEI